MNILQDKKKLSIISSTLVGLAIILIATNNNATKTDGKVAFNNNWQDSLRIIPSLDATTTLAVQKGIHAAENISIGSATSTTDLFSRKTFASYISIIRDTGANNALTDNQASGIANELVKNVTSSSTAYTTKDIKTSPDNSEASVIAYSKSVNKALSAFAALKTNEISIITDAINTKDGAKLAPLLDIIAQYKKLESDLLAIKTPAGLTSLHLRLVQGYESLRIAITAMHDSFNDPVAVLAAFTQYKNGMEALNAVANDYRTAWPIKQ